MKPVNARVAPVVVNAGYGVNVARDEVVRDWKCSVQILLAPEQISLYCFASKSTHSHTLVVQADSQQHVPVDKQRFELANMDTWALSD